MFITFIVLAILPELSETLAYRDEKFHAEKEEPVKERSIAKRTAPTKLGKFTVTAYCGCGRCNGKYRKNGKPITSTGAYAKQGVTIAVDPEVIPYGSVLYLKGIGYRLASDTGGAIKGNRLDLYFEEHTDALMFGRREVEVFIFKEGK